MSHTHSGFSLYLGFLVGLSSLFVVAMTTDVSVGDPPYGTLYPAGVASDRQATEPDSARQTEAQPQKIGAGVTDRPATTIADLHAKPEAFIGKAVRVEGVVTAVCTEMGCWMALAQADKPDQSVRFKVDDDAGIVFPIEAVGKRASAEGVFVRIDPAEAEAHQAEHAAMEHAETEQVSGFSALYQVEATGAIIR